MAGRKPTIGDKARTEKMILYVTPELLEDFKMLAFLNNQSMMERLITLMQRDVDNRADDLQTLKKMKANTD